METPRVQSFLHGPLFSLVRCFFLQFCVFGADPGHDLPLRRLQRSLLQPLCSTFGFCAGRELYEQRLFALCLPSFGDPPIRHEAGISIFVRSAG
jgi:hypothetical protein